MLTFVTFAAPLIFVSCSKRLDKIFNNDDVYTKWNVSTIGVKSHIFPNIMSYDTTYAAQSTDYIDLSAKGQIVFYINQQQHIDTYDTTKYDLLKDTLVSVKNSSYDGSDYVVLNQVTGNSASLEEKFFGIDTENDTFYNLKK